jgi:glycosyltransferase involved in cell wall biosynthesis
MKPAHVGLVVNDWPEPGGLPTGTGRSARDLGELLIAAGVRVSAIATPQDLTWSNPVRRLRDRAIDVVVAPSPLASLRSWYRNLFGMQAVDRWLRETRPDVVHVVHFGFAGIDAAARIRDAGIPVVSASPDALLACAMGHLVNPLIDRPVCRLPVDIATCSACMVYGTAIPPERVHPVQRERRELAAATVAAGPVLTDSRYIKDELCRALPGDYRHVPLPVVGAPATNREMRTGPLRIGFFGPPIWRKGLDVLVAAVDGLDGYELHVYGPKSDRDGAHVDIEAAVAARRLVWHGPYEPENVFALMQSVDVVAIPSRSESLPGVLKEALAAGRPVLASRVAGIPELVKEGQTGWLIPADDVSAWRNALARVIAAPERIRELRPRSDSSPERYVNSVLEIYAEVIESPVDPSRARSLLAAAREIRRSEDSLTADERYQQALIDLRAGRRVHGLVGLLASMRPPRIPRSTSTKQLLMRAPRGYVAATRAVARTRTDA